MVRLFSFMQLSHASDVINVINFREDGQPELSQIGAVNKGEYNLVVLVQLLILLDGEDLSKGNLYEILVRFIEKFQDYLINLVEYSNRTVDLMNGQFSEEIAKMENVRAKDSMNRINKIRMTYMTTPAIANRTAVPRARQAT